MTRAATRGRWLWILIALVTAAAVLIAIGGSEASANPDGKTYTATLTPAQVTAGVDETYTFSVTNTSDSTPLGAVNLVVPMEFEITADPVMVGATSWSASMGSDGRTIELRAAGSSDRLDFGESVQATFGAIGLQEFIGSELWVDYAFPIDARQANTFNGEPGNGLTYVGADPTGPVVRVIGVAKHCTDADCDLEQQLGTNAGGTFTLSGTCADDDCGIIAIDLVSDGADLSTGSVAYTPAPDSTDVRAYLTLSKDVLTQSASRYSFDLYDEQGFLKAEDLSKCHRGDSNCLEKIERTKTDVTWIFRVDPVDPRMDWK